MAATMEYDTDVYFPGIKERMYADISTDKVDAGVKETLSFQNYSFGKTTIPGTDFSVHGDVAHDHFFITGDINDWWVEFRPIDKLTLGLHDTIWTDGAYLPIWDDHVILVTSVATALRRCSSLWSSFALRRLFQQL